MNELDRLRDDLRADPGVPFGPPDLGAVMATGRRIRRRRAIAGAGAAAGVVLATVTGAVVATGALGPGPATPVVPAAPTASAAAVSPTLSPSSSATAGEVVDSTVPTGLRVPGGEIVFRVVAIHIEEQPAIRFGVNVGVRDASGAVQTALTVNETAGSDVAPGFHVVYGPVVDEGVPVPQFGYYAGPAATITGDTPGGTTVAATLAEVPIGADRIVLFWFDPATAGPDQVSGLRATDASGAELTAGTHTSGRG